LSFRNEVGHYQRQLFLVDHAGLPLKTVLEQLDLLGEILPDLRKGFAEGRPAHIPDAPTHASLVAARDVAPSLVELVETEEPAPEERNPELAKGSASRRAAVLDDVTGRSPYPEATEPLVDSTPSLVDSIPSLVELVETPSAEAAR
jgi:hypothetical protein